MLPTTRRLSASSLPRPRDLHLLRGSNLERPNLDFTPLNAEAQPSLVTRSTSSSSLASLQSRSFHTSSPVQAYDSTSYTVTDVPEFFTKYKERRASSSSGSDAQHDELGLMQPVTHLIRTGDLAATTRRLKSKVPVEHQNAEGHIVHSSGFVAPGPGHTSTSDVARAKERERNEKLDLAIQTAAVARSVLESDIEQVNATTLPNFHKIPFEVRELDGSVKHPSGFVPPTPAHEFRCTVLTSACWDRKLPVQKKVLRKPSPTRGVLRAMHTTSVEAS